MDSVLVLIAAPGSGAISAEVVEMLQGFGAETPRWLAEGEALEVPAFAAVPEFLEAIRGAAIDANLVPAQNRAKRLLIADMDSTMIQQECIDELGVMAGIGDHIKQITARAMRGELDFEGALLERVKLLKGLDQGIIGKIIRERISFMPGGKTLIATMKAHGAYTALVSGGFTPFTERVAAELGFDEQQANGLIIEDGVLTGAVEYPILGQQAKLEALRRIAARLGISSLDAIAVGDGANDLAMLGEAGMGVALHAKPQVQAEARFRINHGDLTALLYLQGYEKAAFGKGADAEGDRT
ncbi:phosphoserine phosphatase SerB [Aestuariivirga sp.]|uniref:phosphoserine phosphatase SerB n=1 Tax=Aestuariivirga sp. TaxID=2650926 RepID=UPI003BAB2FB8